MTGKIMMVFILGALGALLVFKFASLPEEMIVADAAGSFFIQTGLEKTGALNLVSAILYDYRGFDSLGESTVIFAAVSGIVLLLSRKRIPVSSQGLSIIVKRTFGVMTPFVFLLAWYIILNGHLSPGGGFQGGVIMAVLTIIFCIVYGSAYDLKRYSPRSKTLLETGGALLFLGMGVLGFLIVGDFLGNPSAWRGQPGDLLSAGSIPLINIGVGLKVGAGLGMIFYSMIQKTFQRETAQ